MSLKSSGSATLTLANGQEYPIKDFKILRVEGGAIPTEEMYPCGDEPQFRKYFPVPTETKVQIEYKLADGFPLSIARDRGVWKDIQTIGGYVGGREWIQDIKITAVMPNSLSFTLLGEVRWVEPT